MQRPETSPERRARQFAQLRRVAELAEAIALAAGAAALAQLAAAAEAPPDTPPPPRPRGPDPATVFARATQALRLVIGLEHRVEAGPGGRPAYERSPTLSDPRRALLRHVLHDAVSGDPDRARRRRDVDRAIDEELLADPAATELIAETLAVICRKLDIDIDPARLPDAFLDFDPDPDDTGDPGVPAAEPPCDAPEPAF